MEIPEKGEISEIRRMQNILGKSGENSTIRGNPGKSGKTRTNLGKSGYYGKMERSAIFGNLSGMGIPFMIVRKSNLAESGFAGKWKRNKKVN